MTVREKRARKRRREATGATRSSRRSSARKNVDSDVTTPLKARKARNDDEQPGQAQPEQEVAELLVAEQLTE